MESVDDKRVISFSLLNISGTKLEKSSKVEKYIEKITLLLYDIMFKNLLCYE